MPCEGRGWTLWGAPRPGGLRLCGAGCAASAAASAAIDASDFAAAANEAAAEAIDAAAACSSVLRHRSSRRGPTSLARICDGAFRLTLARLVGSTAVVGACISH